MRLDCIASAGFGISRSKIAEYIKAEKVNINWEKTVSLTREVKQGDTISIRGKGRVVLESVGGLTKKGRISITLRRT
jgi:RNA-binding protein YlmH